MLQIKRVWRDSGRKGRALAERLNCALVCSGMNKATALPELRHTGKIDRSERSCLLIK